MKNSVELRQERAGLITESNVMLELCKTEVRDFTETEQVSYDEKMNLIDKFKKHIETTMNTPNMLVLHMFKSC